MIETHRKTNTNAQESKAIIALIIASVTPATIISVIVFFMEILDDYERPVLETVSTFTGAGFVVFVVAFIHTFLLGMPLFFLASRFRLIHWWTILIGSFIVGSTPCAILSLPYNSLPERFGFGLSGFIEIVGFMGLCGLTGGFVFWILWRYWIQEKSSDDIDAEN